MDSLLDFRKFSYTHSVILGVVLDFMGGSRFYLEGGDGIGWFKEIELLDMKIPTILLVSC